MSDFVKQLTELLNLNSMENASNTPDFILANFMLKSLEAGNALVQDRDRWYGIAPAPGMQRVIVDQAQELVVVQTNPEPTPEPVVTKDRMDYASTYRAWVEAFGIFSKYEQDYANTAASHDEFYAGGPVEIYSAADRDRLMALGWQIDERTDSFFHYT